jgi:hypothetical protein
MAQVFDITGELRALFEQSATQYKVEGLAGDFDAMFGPEDPVKIAAREAKRLQRAKKKHGDDFVPMTEEEKRASRKKAREAEKAARDQARLEHIAVIDFETDPFDAELRERIFPFTACMLGDGIENPFEIWDEDEDNFVRKVLEMIESLPGSYTIYAHNGGKFDFMFLISKLRGKVAFKGRGIMTAKVGRHELRDSLHLIPEKLSAYRKDPFDYEKMRKANRNAHRDEILAYQRADCVYLFEIVKDFLTRYGFKISIGQAAMSLLKRDYPECENISERTDAWLRGDDKKPGFFYGGRVECIQGAGRWHGSFKLYDVNSMYPAVMAGLRHPVGKKYIPRKGEPGDDTFFVDVTCYSNGAFPTKIKGEGTCFPKAFGRYKVSIYEYRMAEKLGLISNVTINYVVDCETSTTFAKFVEPLYSGRQLAKAHLKTLEAAGDKESADYIGTKKDDIFLKLLQNNGYGKFCTNPRKFREHFLTDPDDEPDEETESWGLFDPHTMEKLAHQPEMTNKDFAIWSRPTERRHYFNVGTGASITGAARAKLMEAKFHAIDPIYCDTDSLICRDLPNIELHPTNLGAWDCEAELDYVVVAGKKTYAYTGPKLKKPVVKSKGTAGVTIADIELLVDGQEIVIKAKAPTLTKSGSQLYIDRTIRSTVKKGGHDGGSNKGHSTHGRVKSARA